MSLMQESDNGQNFTESTDNSLNKSDKLLDEFAYEDEADISGFRGSVTPSEQMILADTSDYKETKLARFGASDDFSNETGSTDQRKMLKVMEVE